MIKAIVWDIGGVLIEDPKIKDFWGENKESKKLRDEFGTGKISVNEFVKQGSRLLNLNEKDFLKEYKKAYFSIRLIKDVFNTFKKIKLQKYILSDSNPLHAEYVKNNFKDILRLTERTFFSHETGSRKSQEESFNYMLKKIKMKSLEIVFIDNKKECTDTAKKLGIHTILFKNNIQLKKDLAKFGVK